MMSSFETSSPVSASTLAYLMRCPVLRLIWLKLIFSESEVAGYKATGQVTSERRKKPFQLLARGAIQKYSKLYRTRIQDDLTSLVPTVNLGYSVAQRPLPICSLFVLIPPHYERAGKGTTATRKIRSGSKRLPKFAIARRGRATVIITSKRSSLLSTNTPKLL